jgi:hypothetical protein
MPMHHDVGDAKTALTIRVSLKDADKTNLCEKHGLKLEPVISLPLTDLLVGSVQVEVT